MENKDEILWAIARKRAGFKKHLASYVIVNAFLWGIWLMTSVRHGFPFDNGFTGFARFPWPVWVMFWWGIGLFFNYMNAYVNYNGNDVEREYQKLKKTNNNQ